MRTRIGEVIAPDRVAGAPAAVRSLVARAAEWPERLAVVRDESIFHVGTSGRVAAELIAAKADAFEARQARS